MTALQGVLTAGIVVVLLGVVVFAIRGVMLGREVHRLRRELRRARIHGPAGTPVEQREVDRILDGLDIAPAVLAAVDRPAVVRAVAEVPGRPRHERIVERGPFRFEETGPLPQTALYAGRHDQWDAPLVTPGTPAALCWECATEDPLPWCDCNGYERCKGPCRRRAHAPGSCATERGYP